MNCHDFETNVFDVATPHLMDAERREKALAHTASCDRCRSRLADERALTSGLRIIATASDEQAPGRVEAALLNAFRQQHGQVAAIAPAKQARRRWLYAAAGVAAAAVIVMLLSLMTSRRPDLQPPVQQNAGNETPIVPDQMRAAFPQAQPAPLSAEGRNVSIRTTQRPRRTFQSAKAGRTEHPADGINKPAAEAEIATEFIPLMNRESFGQLDGAQVVRVELPRSALMSFGLPMDMERAAERIKADVVVGNDGLARAIRFVR